MAAIVKIRDENGNIIEIPAFRGPRGLTGETGSQGPKGDPGDATINDTTTSSTSVWSSQKVVDYLNENYVPEVPVTSVNSKTGDVVLTASDVGALPNTTTLFSGNYNDLTNKPTIPAAVTVDSALSSSSTNPVQNKVVNSALSGKAPTSHASTGTGYGVSTASNYGHAKASSTTPKANGTAAVGSETSSFARGDHVHPVSNVAASKVTAGTLAGKVQANATAAATLANAQVRDIIISTTDLTAGSSTLATGTVYLVYE